MNKEPLSIRFMTFWNARSIAFRYSVAFVIAALLTLVRQLLEGVDLNTVLITFITALITLITGLQGVSKAADKHMVEQYIIPDKDDNLLKQFDSID